MPIPSNAFVALLPSRPEAGQPKSFGREDYITAALGVVLHADTAAGGSLCQHVFRTLFGIDLQGSVQVSVQSELLTAGKLCIIDLHVQTPTQIVFIENKTGARLGLGIDPATQQVEGQLAAYQKVLDSKTQFESTCRHLGMLTWAPPETPEKPDYWTRAAYWWDLFEAVRAHDHRPNDFVARLRADFLDFLAAVELSPPESLTDSNVASASAVQRVLALALQKATLEGARFYNVRPASWGAYLVSTREQGADSTALELQWSVGLWAGFPEVRCANRGYLLVTLPADFRTRALDDQVAWLAQHMWWRVARADSVVRQTPRMSKQEALARCRDARKDVEALLAAADAAKWKRYIGGREVVLSTGSRTAPWKVKLDTWHKSGVNVRVETPSRAAAEAMRQQLSETWAAAKPLSTGKVVAFRLAAVAPGCLQDLPKLIAAIRRPTEPA